MRLADRLGGHLVQGHVDARRRPCATARRCPTAPPGWPSPRPPRCCATSSRRGRSPSTASASPSPAWATTAFEIAVIPHTLAVTTLGASQPGDPVNLEVDVARQVRRTSPRRALHRVGVIMPFTEIENAVAAIERGEIVIVVDDADRENEGDLIMAAEAMTPEAMAFMIRHTSGVICMPVEGSRLDELRLPLMVADNTESQRTAFTVSVDARHGTSTGISAADRATTVHAVLDPATRPEDLARPGPHLPAALPRGRRAQARRSHRGRGRPRPAGRHAPRRGARRGRERRRHHGADAAARGVRGRARAAADLDRRPDPLPPPPREAGAPGLRGPHPHPPRRLHRLRVRVVARRHRAHGVRVRRGGGQGERAGARALRVPHRRRVRLDALRLRPAARRRDGAHRRGGHRRRRLPARPRGPRHRPRPQDPRLHAPGPGSRHRRGQRGARVPGRLARVRHRRRRCSSTSASRPCAS